MFDRIAPAYDLLNSVLSLGIDTRWRKKAIAELPASANSLHILDIATGTGDMCIQARKRYPHYQYTGLDLSDGMLEIGRQRLKKMDILGIELIQGDSEQLDFGDDRFDAVMAAFGVRNFENLDKGLQEIYRVLKPGGKLIVLEFSRPRIFPFRQLFGFYFKNMLPLIGSWGSKDAQAYKYLYESVQQFPDYDRFTDRLTACGFHSVGYHSLSLGICCVYTGLK